VAQRSPRSTLHSILQTCGRRADGSPLTGMSQIGQASLLAALNPPSAHSAHRLPSRRIASIAIIAQDPLPHCHDYGLALSCLALPCLALPCPGLSGNVAPLIGPVLAPPRKPTEPPRADTGPGALASVYLLGLAVLTFRTSSSSLKRLSLLYYSGHTVCPLHSTQLNSTQLHLTSNSSIPTLKIYSHAFC
jgi:hypothetical protein